MDHPALMAGPSVYIALLHSVIPLVFWGHSPQQGGGGGGCGGGGGEGERGGEGGEGGGEGRGGEEESRPYPVLCC